MILRESQLTTNSLMNWLLQNKTVSIKEEPDFIRSVFCSQIRTYFEEFQTSEAKEKIHFKNFCKSDYDGTVMSAALDVQKIVKSTNFFKDFIVHGSTSDLNYVPGWSDFDSIAIVKKDSFLNSKFEDFFKVCLILDEKMRKVDPLQHHGIHYVHEKEMLSWPQLYLPKELLFDGKSVMGNDFINISSVCSKEKEKKRLESIIKTLDKAAKNKVLMHHGLNGKFLKEDYKDQNTMYQLKYYLCVLMLLPSLWCNSRGIYCSKKESFDIIKDNFKNEDLEILEKSLPKKM